MSNRIVWSGLDEFGAELKALPTALTDEAMGIVFDAANGAADAIRAAYPSRTGQLRDGVGVSIPPKAPFVAQAKVSNTSPLASIFENGTEARHYVTKKGKQHLLGRMPPGHVFIPRIIRARRAMNDKLKAMLEQHGLTVSGEP